MARKHQNIATAFLNAAGSLSVTRPTLAHFTDTAEDHALAEKLAAEHGVTARYVQADMSKAGDCRALIEKAGRYPNVDRWGAAMLARPAVAEGMQTGTARAETIEGGLTGFTDEHRSILWGERQHARR